MKHLKLVSIFIKARSIARYKIALTRLQAEGSRRDPAAQNGAEAAAPGRPRRNARPARQQREIKVMTYDLHLDCRAQKYSMRAQSKAVYDQLLVDTEQCKLLHRVRISENTTKYGSVDLKFMKYDLENPVNGFIDDAKVAPSVISVHYIDASKIMGYLDYLMRMVLIPLALNGILFRDGQIVKLVKQVCKVSQSERTEWVKGIGDFLDFPSTLKEAHESPGPWPTVDMETGEVPDDHPITKFRQWRNQHTGEPLQVISQAAKYCVIVGRVNNNFQHFDHLRELYSLMEIQSKSFIAIPGANAAQNSKEILDSLKTISSQVSEVKLVVSSLLEKYSSLEAESSLLLELITLLTSDQLSEMKTADRASYDRFFNEYGKILSNISFAEALRSVSAPLGPVPADRKDPPPPPPETNNGDGEGNDEES